MPNEATLGTLIRGHAQYVDGEGHVEDVYTDGVLIERLNHGEATFALSGDGVSGGTLEVYQIRNDPDGNSRDDVLVDWELSLDGGKVWNAVTEGIEEDNSTRYRLGTDLASGSLIRALVNYEDGEGNTESVYSASRKLGNANDGAAMFALSGDGVSGGILEAYQISNDPDGNSQGDVLVDWELSLNGGEIWNMITEGIEEDNSARYRLGTGLTSGSLIRALVTYVDGEGNAENV